MPAERPPPPPPDVPRRHGLLFAVLSGLFLGATLPLAKHAFAGVSPLFAAGWIYATAGLVFVPVLLVRPPRREDRLRRPDLPWLLGAIAVGCVVAPVCYVQGLAANPAHVTALLVNLEAVFGPLLALAVFGERLSARRLAGLGVLLAAALFTSWMSIFGTGGGVGTGGGAGTGGGGGGGTTAGALWIAAACLAWAFDTNLTRRIAARDARSVVVAHNLGGGCVSLALAALLGRWPHVVAGNTLVEGAIVGVVGYGASFYCLVLALDRLGAARASVTFLIVGAVTGVVASALWSGEMPPAWILGAVVLVGAGVALSTEWGGRRRAFDPAGKEPPA